ncbi:hypothetical protein AA637_13810 [Cyanobacterium sp. HL-69]|nr:hypothetical protein AA637_13810 [Cyanobacterium sp. HL-69]
MIIAFLLQFVKKIAFFIDFYILLGYDRNVFYIIEIQSFIFIFSKAPIV